MTLTEWREKTKLVDDNGVFDADRSEKVGAEMTLADAAELARETVLRPTVHHREDEEVLRTLAAALAAAVESHKE